MDRREFLICTAQGAALLTVGGCTIPPRSYKVLEVPRGGLRISLVDYPELKKPGGIVRIVTPRHRVDWLWWSPGPTGAICRSEGQPIQRARAHAERGDGRCARRRAGDGR